MAKRYFIRTADGHKGPYTLAQMKASIKAGTFSPQAEYRVGEDGEWKPVKKLADRIAKEEPDRPRERILSEDQRLPPPRPAESTLLARLAMLGVFAAIGLSYWLWQHHSRHEALGRPCKAPADCPDTATCMQTIQDEDRTIDPVGYCTFECTDSSDCSQGMTCEEAMMVDEQRGNKWDGMFRKSTRVCTRR